LEVPGTYLRFSVVGDRFLPSESAVRARSGQKDLKVTTNDGKTVGHTDRVRVSGRMYYPSSMANVEFKCGLDNTLIESARASGK
jgi:hypothetical protein